MGCTRVVRVVRLVSTTDTVMNLAEGNIHLHFLDFVQGPLDLPLNSPRRCVLAPTAQAQFPTLRFCILAKENTLNLAVYLKLYGHQAGARHDPRACGKTVWKCGQNLSTTLECAHKTSICGHSSGSSLGICQERSGLLVFTSTSGGSHLVGLPCSNARRALGRCLP